VFGLLVKAAAVCLTVTAVLTLWEASGHVQEPIPDVGLLTQVSGEVSFWNETDCQKPSRPQSFMKVRRGDHFKLPTGATIQVLYFGNGRQETWTGPVTFRCGDTESISTAKTSTGEVKPEVKLLPSRVSQRLMTAPLPLPRSSVRYSGTIQTMTPKYPPKPVPKMPEPPSAETKKKIEAAQETYRHLANQAKPDEVTPELYYLGVLAEYCQYREMQAVVDAMLAKRPGDPTIKDLKAWVQTLSTTKPPQQNN
jgi:hypothetical protein